MIVVILDFIRTPYTKPLGSQTSALSCTSRTTLA